MHLRVLLVTSEFPPDIGGIGSHVAELARELAASVERVTVVHPRSLVGRTPAEQFGPYDVVRPALIKSEPFYQLLLGRWLHTRLRRYPFDIVHVHGMRPLGATKVVPVPVVFTNHSSGFLARLAASPRRKKRTSGLLEHLCCLIGPSDELVEAARKVGYKGPAAMIPNGVDPERFKPGTSAVRAHLGIDDDDVVVLLARRLVEKNGIVWFAHALRHLKGSNCRIIVAGTGPELERMQAILTENGMLERTVFLGSVANTDMPALYRAADLSVLPSLAEATSIAGLEAMACGLPLIGTRVGGIPTLIDNDTGVLVPPRDPDALGEALLRLVRDRGERMRMGMAARAKVEREFAWTAIARRTMNVYASCLESSPQ